MLAFWNYLEKAGQGLVIFLVGLLFSQVVARYLFNFSIFWSEELARFIFIYLVLIGACIMARGREHIRITYFVSLLPQSVQQRIKLVVDFLVMFFLVILFVTSLVKVKTSFNTVSQALEIPWAYIYLACTLSAAIMLTDRISPYVKKIIGPRRS